MVKESRNMGQSAVEEFIEAVVMKHCIKIYVRQRKAEIPMLRATSYILANGLPFHAKTKIEETMAAIKQAEEHFAIIDKRTTDLYCAIESALLQDVNKFVLVDKGIRTLIDSLTDEAAVDYYIEKDKDGYFEKPKELL